MNDAKERVSTLTDQDKRHSELQKTIRDAQQRLLLHTSLIETHQQTLSARHAVRIKADDELTSRYDGIVKC